MKKRDMKYKNDPKFWALIGFCVGAVLASAGSISNPLDSILGGLVQSGIWFIVSRQIIKSKNIKDKSENDVSSARTNLAKSTLFLFDRPVHKDWMFYIFIFILFSNTVGGLQNVSRSGGLTTDTFGAISGLGDAFFRVLLSWFPFIPIIYFVRKYVRKKRTIGSK